MKNKRLHRPAKPLSQRILHRIQKYHTSHSNTAFGILAHEAQRTFKPFLLEFSRSWPHSQAWRLRARPAARNSSVVDTMLDSTHVVRQRAEKERPRRCHGLYFALWLLIFMIEFIGSNTNGNVILKLNRSLHFRAGRQTTARTREA